MSDVTHDPGSNAATQGVAVADEPCGTCGGQGRVPEYVTITRDMASDACEAAWAGETMYWGETDCPSCGGYGTKP